ncbi:MAG: ABC transporter permease subunit [Verrucomicrobiota bacterium]|nr:ABC transporter permease subunit [Verrucomicrobiota bacterium]
MTTWPVIECELRKSCRKSTTYWSRVWPALLMLLIIGWCLWIIQRHGTIGLGNDHLFMGLSCIAFLQVLFSGASRTADCISEEKRDGTLGFLFLTDLKGYDVVLGKLLANSLTTFYALLGIFPALGILLLLGGVTGQMLWKVALSLLCALFYSVSLGVLISTFFFKATRAASAAGWILLFLAVGIPTITFLLQDWGGYHHWAFYLNFLSPIHMQRIALMSGIGFTQQYFWNAVAINLFFAFLFLFWASRRLPHTWQDVSVSREPLWKRIIEKLSIGSAKARHAFRIRLLQANPFYWLSERKAVWPLGTSMTLLIWFLTGYFFWDEENSRNEGIIACLIIAVSILFRCLVATHACRQIAEDRHSGALELILATEISVKEIIAGQFMAIRRRYLIPFIVAQLCLGWVAWINDRGRGWGDQELLEWYLANLLCVIVDCLTLPWVSVWMGLRTPHPSHAPAAAFVRIVVLPLVLLIGLVTFLMYFRLLKYLEDPTMIAVAWVFFTIVNGVWFATRARRRTLQEFRIAATDRYQPQKSKTFLQRLFRREKVHSQATAL